METKWTADPTVLDAVRRFILALVILGMALLGYNVEITQSPAEATPTPVVMDVAA